MNCLFYYVSSSLYKSLCVYVFVFVFVYAQYLVLLRVCSFCFVLSCLVFGLVSPSPSASALSVH